MWPDRIERITRHLGLLAWHATVVVIAQSLPDIPVSWRLPILIGNGVILAVHVAVCLWRDGHDGRGQGGDDAS